MARRSIQSTIIWLLIVGAPVVSAQSVRSGRISSDSDSAAFVLMKAVTKYRTVTRDVLSISGLVAGTYSLGRAFSLWESTLQTEGKQVMAVVGLGYLGISTHALLSPSPAETSFVSICAIENLEERERESLKWLSESAIERKRKRLTAAGGLLTSALYLLIAEPYKKQASPDTPLDETAFGRLMAGSAGALGLACLLFRSPEEKVIRRCQAIRN